jgi:hypothetical protein
MDHKPMEITVGNLEPIKVRYVNAHQKNPFYHSEGGWNQQVDIPVCFLDVATWVHGISEHGVAAEMQRWADHHHLLLVPSESNKNNLSATQRVKDYREMWLVLWFAHGFSPQTHAGV